MKREFLQNFKVGEHALPKDIIDAIMAENGKDIQAARQELSGWEEKYNQAVQSYEAKLRQVQFQSVFRDAVRQTGGRNEKAIAALLDMAALEKSENPQESIASALEALKKQHDYLFAAVVTPPPFAAGTGTQVSEPPVQVQSLAGALRERFSN